MPHAQRSFQVWAPYATRGVDLHLAGERHPMSEAGDGWWWVQAQAATGERYGFRIDGGPLLPDPRAESLPDGPDGAAEVVERARTARIRPAASAASTADAVNPADPADPGTDADAAPGEPALPAATDGILLEGAVCYELSVDTFSAEGTFDGVAGHLDHLADLGVDLVLLGPVAGYDARAPLVVDPRYGGPRRLAALVQACHVRGMGVGVDLVLGCRDPDGSPLNNFAPYFHASPDTASGWAPNLDGPNSDHVRAFWLATALHWLGEFDLDALRLRDAGALADRRALTFVEELALVMSEVSGQTGRPRWLIADDDRLDPRTVTAVDEGGLGCDAVPAPQVGRGIWQAVTGPPDRVAGTLRRVLADPFWSAGGYSPRHGRSNGRALDPAAVPGWRFLTGVCGPGTQPPDPTLIGRRRWCCAVALLLTGATTPLLAMGEEWGAIAVHPEPDAGSPRPLDWAAASADDGSMLITWYRALLALRSARPELRDASLPGVEVRRGDRPGVAVVHRGGHRIALNLGSGPATVDLGLQTSHRQVVLLSLDPTTAVSYEGTLDLPPDGLAVVGPTVNPGGLK